MTIARSSVDLLGSSAAPQSVGAGATVTGAAVDLLGDDASVGEFVLRLKLIGAAAGSINVRVNSADRAGTQVYSAPAYQHNPTTASGTTYYTLGRYSAARKVSCDVQNNDSTNGVSVWVWAELEKVN